jgi:hypothetical protein
MFCDGQHRFGPELGHHPRLLHPVDQQDGLLPSARQLALEPVGDIHRQRGYEPGSFESFTRMADFRRRI